MNLNVDIKDLFKKKKEKYPTKRYMNLYHKDDRHNKSATVALYVIFAIVMALGFAKVMIYDYIVKVSTLREINAQQEEELLSKQLEMKEYNDVKTKYVRYSSTDKEDSQINRMEILDLVDSYIRANANVTSVSISGFDVLVQFTSESLSKSAEIAAQIDKLPIVEKTTVDTASTNKDEQSGNGVQTSMLIELVGGKEQENEET